MEDKLYCRTPYLTDGVYPLVGIPKRCSLIREEQKKSSDARQSYTEEPSEEAIELTLDEINELLPETSGHHIMLKVLLPQQTNRR